MPKTTEEQLRELYPVADVYTPLEGVDIQRTKRRITALVVVEDERGGKDLRFYSWVGRRAKPVRGRPPKEGRKNPYEWRVDLARLSTLDWNFSSVAVEAGRLAKKYSINLPGYT